MALIIEDEYAGKSNPSSAEYPGGSHRDIVSEGDGTGTPRTARGQNDWLGFFLKLLDASGIAPSGSPDTVLSSDYFDSIMLLVVRPTPTVATMKLLKGVKPGNVVKTDEFSDGDSGGGTYNALTKGITPGVDLPNTFNIIVSTTDPNIVFVLIEPLPLDVRTYGINVNAADNQAATQQMADNQVPSIKFIGSGSYKYLTPVIFNYSVEVFASPEAVVDGAGAGFVGDEVFKFIGSGLTQIADLNANVAKGDTSITFDAPIALTKDDIFLIANPTDFSWSGFRAAYKAGEYCEVISVSGNTVKLKNPLYDSYVVANVDIYKQDSISPNIHDIKINGSVSGNVIRIEFCKDAKLTNVTSTHDNNAILSEVNCYHTEIRNPNWSNEGDGGDDYGWVVSRSQHSRMFGGSVYARRHSVTMGGGTGVGVIPTRDIKVIGGIHKNDAAAGVHNFDWHGHCEGCQGIDLTIFGGATWQGQDNGYINCDIYNYSGEFVCIRGAEIRGGRHYAINCRLINFGDPSVGARGVVDVGGNSVVISADTIEDVVLSLKGCTVNGQAFSNITSILLARNRGTTKKISIDIDDLTLNVNDIGQVLFLDKISGTADSDFIIVDNIKTQLAAKKIANVDANYLNFSMRLQGEFGAEEKTTSTGASTLNFTTFTFKWIYPRVPVVTAAMSKRNKIGGKFPVISIDPMTTTTLTAIIGTPDGTNFTSALTMTANWQIGIKEI